MRSLRLMGLGMGALLMLGTAAQGQNLAISIGIRETNSEALAIGANGGATGGIEFVNLDGLTLNLDGTFQTFTFTFGTDPLTAFAGTTANGMLDGTRGVLEHIRIRNIEGITEPIDIYIDNVRNTTAAGGTTLLTGFEGFDEGTEVLFQEPRFSGSTVGNLLEEPNFAGTNSTMASEGDSSYLVQFQFIDDTPTRWVRLTSFNAANLPNAVIDFTPGSTLSFDLKGIVVPEPGSLTLFGLGAAAMLGRRRRA